MIGVLLLYGAAALLVVHVALDLRNVRHALHSLRAAEDGPSVCQRCYSPAEPPEHGWPARDLWWTVITMVVLLAHLATDLIGGIP
jgi:hypothetical protein